MAFKYLISEYYSRDMSIKTKSAKYAKMQRGEYQSKVCPYGYRKSANGRMEPNPETAAVVQLIFQLAATGIGAAAVTRELFKRGIPTPGEHKAAHGQQYHDVSRSRGRWSSSTILRILEDERYIGSYVIGRRAVIEVGGTRSRRKDRDKWFIIPDHHPAIVDKELFEKVQAVQRRFSLPTRKARDYPLKGKVYCGCCDHALSRITQKKPFYMCRHALCSPFALVSKKQQIPHQRDGGGIRTLGLRFALPKNPGPGVTGAYFPFYTCRRRSIDAAIFAPKKQQIPHQRDGGGITTLGASRVLQTLCVRRG